MADPQEAKRAFFDEQYRGMAGEESEALDYPLYRFLLPYAQQRVDVAASMLKGRTFAHVVELGVGNGELLEKMCSQFERYDGFDISTYQLDNITAALRDRTNIRVHQADLDAPLPLPDGTADLIISLSTIEYLRDPHTFLDEVWRLIVPGGRLLLHTMNLAFLPRRLQLLLGRLPTFNSAAGWQGGVLHQFTFPTMRDLLLSRGFVVEREACAGLAPALRLWWRNALASDMLFLARKPA